MGDFGVRVKPGEALVITPEAVGVAAGQLLLVAGDAANRISIHFQNQSVNIIYIGTTAGVTANNGRALAAASGANLGDGGAWTIDLSDLQSLWAIASGAHSNLIVVELIGV